MTELEALQRVFVCAEMLSTAVVNSEAHGADYHHVDKEWEALTAVIQEYYQIA